MVTSADAVHPGLSMQACLVTTCLRGVSVRSRDWAMLLLQPLEALPSVSKLLLQLGVLNLHVFHSLPQLCHCLLPVGKLAFMYLHATASCKSATLLPTTKYRSIVSCTRWSTLCPEIRLQAFATNQVSNMLFVSLNAMAMALSVLWC